MNICKICGQPCGIYEICRDCQQDVNDGKIKQCPSCKEYYFSNNPHQCKPNQARVETIQQNNENTSSSQDEQKYEEDSNHTGTFGKAFGVVTGTGCGCAALIVGGLILLIIFIGFLVSGI